MTSSEVLVAGGHQTGAVGDQMITSPKTLPVDASVRDVRAAFGNDHVHLVLLTDGSMLRGALLRDDLPGSHDDASALAIATLEGRTIGPSASMEQACQVLAATDARRLAVIDTDGSLLGLLCLKRRRTGFCGETDLAARRASARDRRSAVNGQPALVACVNQPAP